MDKSTFILVTFILIALASYIVSHFRQKRLNSGTLQNNESLVNELSENFPHHHFSTNKNVSEIFECVFSVVNNSNYNIHNIDETQRIITIADDQYVKSHVAFILMWIAEMQSCNIVNIGVYNSPNYLSDMDYNAFYNKIKSSILYINNKMNISMTQNNLNFTQINTMNNPSNGHQHYDTIKSIAIESSYVIYKCNICKNQFNIDRAKIPNSNFGLTCPSCKTKVICTFDGLNILVVENPT